MKELNITLFEIFGYMLPGVIATIAVSLFFYIFTFSGTEVVLPQFSNVLVGSIAVISYFTGHVVQSLANILFRKMYRAEEVLLETANDEVALGWFLTLERKIDGKFFGNHNKLPSDLLESIATSLSNIYKITPNTISPSTMYKLCDSYVLQKGNVSEREIYTYREGFYRGLSVACLMLLVATLTMCFLEPFTVVCLKTFAVDLRVKDFLFLSALSSIGTILFYYRYKRFYNYRVVIAVTSFIALAYKDNNEEGT